MSSEKAPTLTFSSKASLELMLEALEKTRPLVIVASQIQSFRSGDTSQADMAAQELLRSASVASPPYFGTPNVDPTESFDVHATFTWLGFVAFRP